MRLKVLTARVDAADIALIGRIDRLNKANRRIKHCSIDKEADDKYANRRQDLVASRGHAFLNNDGRSNGRCTKDERQQDHRTTLRGPGSRCWRHRGQSHSKPAQGDKTHHTDIKQSRKAPLQVHPQGHDRRDQPHIENEQRRIRALDNAGPNDKGRDKSEIENVSGCLAHTDFPLNRPVGRNSNTMIRITKLTANL